MHPNAALIQRFYDAFQRRDADAMVACYTPDVVFTDPAFGRLEGPRAGAMWKMLCTRAQDLEIRASAVEADDTTGAAHWDADYTFSATGRKVQNKIDASFRFRDGLICEHTDRFDFARWCRMALGPTGWLMTVVPPLQGKVRQQALAGLESWIRKQAGAA